MEMEFPDLISSSLPCFVCFGLFGLLKNDAHGACMGRIPTPTKTHTRATHGACAPPATQHTTTANLYFLIYRPRSPPRALAPTPQKKRARIPRGGECPICDKHYTYNTTTSSLCTTNKKSRRMRRTTGVRPSARSNDGTTSAAVPPDPSVDSINLRRTKQAYISLANHQKCLLGSSDCLPPSARSRKP